MRTETKRDDVLKRELDDVLAQIETALGKREAPRPPEDVFGTDEDKARDREIFERHKGDKLAIDYFDSPNKAQPWVDALGAAIKRDLLKPNGLKWDDRFAVALSVQGANLRPYEAGSTWPIERKVWVDAQQPPLYVAATLAHEYLHTTQETFISNKQAHGPEFAAGLNAMGLIGPATASIPGPKFEEWFKQHAPKPEQFV